MPNLRRWQQAKILNQVMDDDGYQRDRKEQNLLTLEALLGIAAAEMRRRKTQAKEVKA